MDASPTGLPFLPPKYVPLLVLLGAAAGAVMALAPEHTVAYKVASTVLGLLAVVGVVSPGMRKAPPEDPKVDKFIKVVESVKRPEQ